MTHELRDKKTLFLIATPLVFLSSYLLGLFLIARFSEEPWDRIIIFPPEPLGSHGILTLVAQGLAFLGAVGLIWLVPGFLLALATK